MGAIVAAVSPEIDNGHPEEEGPRHTGMQKFVSCFQHFNV